MFSLSFKLKKMLLLAAVILGVVALLWTLDAIASRRDLAATDFYAFWMASRLTAQGMDPYSAADWTAEVNYLANTEGSMLMSLPVGPETRVALKPGLNRVYVRLSGAGNTINVAAATGSLTVCVASGPVGYLAPRPPG